MLGSSPNREPTLGPFLGQVCFFKNYHCLFREAYAKSQFAVFKEHSDVMLTPEIKEACLDCHCVMFTLQKMEFIKRTLIESSRTPHNLRISPYQMCGSFVHSQIPQFLFYRPAYQKVPWPVAEGLSPGLMGLYIGYCPHSVTVG